MSNTNTSKARLQDDNVLNRSHSSNKLRICYLHIYSSESSHKSGITRYGLLLSQEGKYQDKIIVSDYNLTLSGEAEAINQHIKHAVNYAKDFDLVHFQFGKYIFTEGIDQFRCIRYLFQHLHVPVVVTIHDIHESLYPKQNIIALLIEENYRRRRWSEFKSLALRSTWVQYIKNYYPDKRVMQCILARSSQVLVCHQEEKERLSNLRGSSKIQVINHFVEERHNKLPYGEAKAALGLSEHEKIITLQGFIYPGKGHLLAVETLAELPENVYMVFAGGEVENSDNFLGNLLNIAKQKSISHRLRITGYLSDPDLDLYLSATDLAICPFQDFSASGSLSTWISFEKPILTPDFEQIREYNNLVPNAISTFSPYRVETFAAAILENLSQSFDSSNIQKLRKHLSLTKTWQRHLDLYEKVTKRC